MNNKHNENIGRAREWIAYLKKTAKHPSGNLGELLKDMIDDAIAGQARIDELEKAAKEAHKLSEETKLLIKATKKKKDKHAISDEAKVTIKSDEDAKLPSEEGDKNVQP